METDKPLSNGSLQVSTYTRKNIPATKTIRELQEDIDNLRRDNILLRNENNELSQCLNKSSQAAHRYSRQMNSANRRLETLKRIAALLTAGSLAVGGIVGHHLGKGKEIELLPFQGHEQTLEEYDDNISSAIKEYSQIVQCENLSQDQEAQFYRVVHNEIIPNSNVIVGNYIETAKTKIAQAIGVSDPQSIQILFDINGKVLVQHSNSNVILATYPLSSFEDTSISAALISLANFNRDYLSSNALNDIKNQNNILVVSDNERSYLNSVIGMASHEGDLKNAQIHFDPEKKKFIEVQPVDEKEPVNEKAEELEI